MRIYEEVNEYFCKPVYSWIVAGATKSQAKKLADSSWKKIGKACWVTDDPELAADTANKFGCDIVSNGSHQIHDYAVILCDPLVRS